MISVCTENINVSHSIPGTLCDSNDDINAFMCMFQLQQKTI